jgi:hypothetical protein
VVEIEPLVAVIGRKGDLVQALDLVLTEHEGNRLADRELGKNLKLFRPLDRVGVLGRNDLALHEREGRDRDVVKLTDTGEVERRNHASGLVEQDTVGAVPSVARQTKSHLMEVRRLGGALPQLRIQRGGRAESAKAVRTPYLHGNFFL